MTKLIAIDIGGTSIKFSLWDGETLGPVQSRPTPANIDDFYAVLKDGADAVRGDAEVEGVAISSPGSVNQATGVIEGASAIPYIHNFEIQPRLVDLFGLPVTLENDANCAALAELAAGAGVGHHSLLFLVIGTGVGGAVVVNDRIWHGAHLYGGEFGYMLMRPEGTLSEIVSPVNLANRYNAATGDHIDGKTLFERAEARDPQAMRLVADAEAVLGKAIFNLQYAFDPERILIGGAISENAKFLDGVRAAVDAVKARVGIGDITPEILPCEYLGEANLRGAVVNFEQQVD